MTGGTHAQGHGRGALWRRARPWLFGAFLAVVLVLLVRYARNVEWREVGTVLAAYDAKILLGAAVLALVSYLLYAAYDLAARAWTGHSLSRRRVALIAAISYAFNLNLGALVGGAGFRVRMYTRSGLELGVVARIIGFSVATNWLGYVLLAGGLFASAQVALPENWPIGATVLRALGVAMLLAVAGYLAACALRRERAFTLRGHRFELPSLRLAGLQLALSAANWLAIGAILYVLLRMDVPYPTVLGVLLVAAIGAAMVHVPAGLGVLEAVFIALLGARVGEPTLLAALLAYRAIYYVVPLAIATALYAAFEARGGKRSNARGRSRTGTASRPADFKSAASTGSATRAPAGSR